MRRHHIFFLFAVAACNPYDPDLGAAPFLCGPADQSPRCPSGYTCKEQGSGAPPVCLTADGTVPPDAGNTNCADDSSLEPNNDIGNAWVTPVATTKTSFPLGSLAICPAGDKDHYTVTIPTQGQNLELLIEYDTAGAALEVAILNSGGITINQGTSTGSGMKRAYVANLPVGTYYASVYGPMMGTLRTNNYSLTFNVTGP